jgi:hypothetical protein
MGSQLLPLLPLFKQNHSLIARIAQMIPRENRVCERDVFDFELGAWVSDDTIADWRSHRKICSWISITPSKGVIFGGS